MSTISKSGIRALLITLFTMLIISSLVVLVKAKNSSSEVKEVEKTTVLAPVWFEYTSTSTNPLDYDEANNYTLSPNPTTGSDCPEGDAIRCKIKALPSEDNPNKPDMDTVIEFHNRSL